MTAEQPTEETVLTHGISPEPAVSHGGDVQLKAIRICLLTALPFVTVFFVLNFMQGLYGILTLAMEMLITGLFTNTTINNGLMKL